MNLSIKNLSKTYSNGVKAIDDVSLDISNGMFGLLGPNGAGKSSLMRVLATLSNPDTGSAKLNEIDIIKDREGLRKQLGYLPQEFGVFPKISAYDMLYHIAILKGLSSNTKDIVNNMLDKVNLYDVRKKNVSDFSGGMRQRFGIAQALINEPNLIIVDEPTAGLDPTERNRFHNILARVAENKIVILSTHIVQDVVELCNDMAVMNHGKIQFHGKPNEALTILNDKVYGKYVDIDKMDEFEKNNKILSQRLISGKNYVNIYTETPNEPDLEKLNPTLEDVFFYMTSK